MAWQSRYLAWHLCCPVLLGEGKNGVSPGEKGIPEEGCWLSNPPPRAPSLLGESGHGASGLPVAQPWHGVHGAFRNTIVAQGF